MRIVALFRVSTERQENEGASLAAQERSYRELAARNGWHTVAEFRGQESAAKVAAEREVLQRVLETLRSDDVDAIWVYEQSRLTRGDELEVALLLRELRERGVTVIVGSTTRDLGSIDDRTMVTVQGAFDRAERDRMLERTSRGRREKAKQGRRAGGGAPYGYRNPERGDPARGILQPIEPEATVVRRIFREIAAGVSQRKLCDALNGESIPAPRGGEWGKTTIRRIIENPAYIGTQFSGAWRQATWAKTLRFEPKNPRAIVVEGAHEPLVSRELWQAAMDRQGGHSTGVPGLLTGFLWIDGERANIDRSRGRSYYRRADDAPGPWFPVVRLNSTVWGAFENLVHDEETLRRVFTGARRGTNATARQTDVATLERRRAKVAARIDNLVRLRADGEITREMLAEQSAAARTELLAIEASIRSAKRRQTVASDSHVAAGLEALRAIATGLLSTEARRRLLQSLIDSVHVELFATPTAQPRVALGRFSTLDDTAKWRIDKVFFRVRGSDTGASGCGRSLVTVQVVENGELLLAPRIVRRRLARA